jgi:hypothetical protein
MTTISATCVSIGTIPVATDAYIYNMITGQRFDLPANSILTELNIRRVNHTNELVNDLLTADRSVIFGIPGDPIAFTGTYGVGTNDLNNDYFANIVDKPVTDITRFPQKVPVPIVIRSGLLGDITEGQILVNVKYKSFPTNTPITGAGGLGNIRHLLS